METGLIVIIAYARFLRDGLRILLQTLPGIGAINLLENAQQLLTLPVQAVPALLVWDWADAEADGRLMLAQIQARWPAVRTLALVDDEEQGTAALGAGVDIVLTKGTRAVKVLAAVKDLLDTPQGGIVIHSQCLATGACLDDDRPLPFRPLALTLRTQ